MNASSWRPTHPACGRRKHQAGHQERWPPHTPRTPAARKPHHDDVTAIPVLLEVASQDLASIPPVTEQTVWHVRTVPQRLVHGSRPGNGPVPGSPAQALPAERSRARGSGPFPGSRSLRGNDVPGVENETWTYEQAHAWYRHRFYRFEPDLNTDNPAVREEIRKVALFWVGLGVTGFRIDKILSQAGDVLTGPHGEASEENPGNVGPRPRVSRAAGRPGLHLHELPDLLMWPRGRAASLGWSGTFTWEVPP